MECACLLPSAGFTPWMSAMRGKPGSDTQFRFPLWVARSQILEPHTASRSVDSGIGAGRWTAPEVYLLQQNTVILLVLWLLGSRYLVNLVFQNNYQPPLRGYQYMHDLLRLETYSLPIECGLLLCFSWSFHAELCSILSGKVNKSIYKILGVSV